MKNIIMSVLLVLFVMVSVTMAQVPSDLSFLTSKAVLRSYLVEQAKEATITAYSESAPQRTEHSIGWSEAPLSSMQLFADLDRVSEQLQIEVVNPEDNIYVFGNVYNSKGDHILSGFGYTRAEWTKGGGMEVQPLEVQYDVPYYLALDMFVEDARFYLTDEKGATVNEISLFTGKDGRVYFQTDLVGQGIIYGRTVDGLEVRYDLRNGGGIRQDIVALNFGGKTSSSMRNMPSYKNAEYIQELIPSHQGRGENITIELVMDANQRTRLIGFSVKTTEGAKPHGYMIRVRGSSEWNFQAQLINVDYAVWQFGPGVYYIVPVWDPQDFQEWPLPTDNGGKG